MVKTLIINADDLGFSLGVNEAILLANNQGFLTHASLMANTQYFDHAVNEIIPQTKELQIGVHLNLTCAKALYKENVLTRNGFLENTFVNLLFRRKTKEVIDSLEKEIELQIRSYAKYVLFILLFLSQFLIKIIVLSREVFNESTATSCAN